MHSVACHIVDTQEDHDTEMFWFGGGCIGAQGDPEGDLVDVFRGGRVRIRLNNNTPVYLYNDFASTAAYCLGVRDGGVVFLEGCQIVKENAGVGILVYSANTSGGLVLPAGPPGQLSFLGASSRVITAR